MRNDIAAIRDKYLSDDTAFNELYPYSIRFMAQRHWTPINVAIQVISFLGIPGSNILDIGSGGGKFCLLAAYHAPDVQVTGVEQRTYLINNARRVQKALDIPNANFINSNFADLDISTFNHFYFYNSFYENIEAEDRIDGEVACSEALYNQYVQTLSRGLKGLPIGTRIATYHSGEDEIPKEYRCVESREGGELKFWVRQ